MEDKIINWICKRITKNQNSLVMVTGGTGSGKSFSALRIAEDCSKVFKLNFDVRNVVFTQQEFMARINSGELNKGSVMIFDEFGVGMNARQSLTMGNKLISFLLQTFRHQNFIVLFTSPHFGYVDKSARGLFHLRFETISIDREKELCLLKPQLGKINQKTGETKWKLPKLSRNKFLGVYGAKKPSQKLIEEYEAKKEAYTSQLNQDILKQLGSVDRWGREIKKPKKKPFPKELEAIGKTIDKLWKQVN